MAPTLRRLQGILPPTNGVFSIALDPRAYNELETYKERCGAILRGVKSREAEPGSRIMIPGQPEWEERRRVREGVPLPESVWRGLVGLVEELGVEEALPRVLTGNLKGVGA